MVDLHSAVNGLLRRQVDDARLLDDAQQRLISGDKGDVALPQQLGARLRAQLVS